MGNSSTSSRSFWLTILAFTIIVNLAMMRSVHLHLLEIEADLLRSTWGWMLTVFLGIGILCAWMMIRIVGNKTEFVERVEQIGSNKPFQRLIGAVVFIAVAYLIPYVKFAYQIGQEVKQPVYDPVFLLLFYYWMCWWLILLGSGALKIAFQTTWLGGFASAAVLLGLAFEIFFRYSFVTDYPLSMGWSEGSRYYYASLFFSKQIYGESFPLSTLHPTRYLLQSFPFLIPSLGIFAHRFWQFLLWIGLTAGAAVAITRRVFAPEEKALRWLTAGWLFLFFLRVGVYYHLEVMVILPLLFVSANKPRQSLIVVILASLWAGVSRVNWFPVPAMIAAAIHLLETPLTSGTGEKVSFKLFAKYLSRPALWMFAGLFAALFAQWAYVYVSGNAHNAEAFTSSFTSDLLWYRLWPNENFPLGVVPGILIVSGPLLAILILAARRKETLHSIRWLGLIAIIVVLFAGSVVVSAKIGGGGDLHNMDTYAVLVGIVGLYFFGGRARSEGDSQASQVRPPPVIAVALMMPLLVLIPMLSPYPEYNEGWNRQAHQQLVDVVNDIGKRGPVLFINERQLVALGDVDVPLVYDYEVVTMMEMAMSGNRAYLEKFYDDLENHRFAAIVSGRQNLTIKQEGVFAEENNVWNTFVSPYILCNYESSMTVEADDSRIEIYVPRTQTGICPSGK